MSAPPFARAGCDGIAYLSDEARSLLTPRRACESREPSTAAAPRSRFVMGGRMGGGGGGMGTLQALLTELSGPEEAARLLQPRASAGRSACGRSRRRSTASSS